MERRKTLTMDWNGLGDDDDDDDAFFESYNRLSAAFPGDLASSSDEDDARLSFVSAVSSVHSRKKRANPPTNASVSTMSDYSIWMKVPTSITERRKRLLHGMGLDNDNNDFFKASSVQLGRAISKKIENGHKPVSFSNDISNKSALLPVTLTSCNSAKKKTTEQSSVDAVSVRGSSDVDVGLSSIEKTRKKEMIGNVSKQHLTRTSSVASFPCARKSMNADGSKAVARESYEGGGKSKRYTGKLEDSGLRAFFLIKNLKTGTDFVVNEYNEREMWNRLSELQNRKQLTMDEFEKAVGESHVENEVMRRHNGSGFERKLSSGISKRLKLSKKRGAALLRNIKDVATGFKGERERESVPVSMVVQQQEQVQEVKNQWVRVRQSGKSHKDLSALHLCQEFQAHDGCIWTIKFNLDGRYLASGGEDKVIHVWEVQECELMSFRLEEENLTPLHPSMLASLDSPLFSSEKKKGKKGNAIPEYVHVPEIVFSLSDIPYCSFEGHSDDVLDLSWSKSQLLLSSSMDKTVRLWNLETKTCLKMFAHNDYVTCIQFNPIDDDYFISGSLDAKVRIWSITQHHVVNWTDIHEMVTAVSYTPDAQGAFIGTHKGGCRTYSTEGCKLSQTGTIELRHKKKSLLRKVTGFQFATGKPSEVLVTSADSRIKILEDSEVVHKFKGFRNANSQIAASFSPDGRYIISASEDSQVYVWNYEENRNSCTGKGRNMIVTRSHEHFQCKDVSIAIAWPCTIKCDPPLAPVHHSKRHLRCSLVASHCGEDSTTSTNGKKTLPPLPKKSNNHASESGSTSPKEDPAAIPLTESNCHTTEEDLEAISTPDLGNGDSFSSGSPSAKFGDLPSISTSATSALWSSYSLLEGSHGSSTILASAWGLVIVTAGYGGEIRCYQNFGLPKRMNRML